MTIEHLVPGFEPETPLERELGADATLLDGLAWGRPRPGHPEGSVGRHVSTVLDAISEPAGDRRRELRFLAIVHDACKCRVRPGRPFSRLNDHAVLARSLGERYTSDARLLDTLELHDTPYRIWRDLETGPAGTARLRALLARVPDRDLFLRFVELDSSTAGKHPEPLTWLCNVVAADAGHLSMAA